jgi:hypothetical protein
VAGGRGRPGADRGDAHRRPGEDDEARQKKREGMTKKAQGAGEFNDVGAAACPALAAGEASLAPTPTLAR